MAKTVTISPPFEQVIAKAEGIITFDTGNQYPNQTNYLIDRSVTATRVTSEKSRFIYGKGMTTEGRFWKKVINTTTGMRVDQFFRYVINEYSRHKGFAIHVNYNALGEIQDLRPIEFSLPRIGKPDDADYKGKIVLSNQWNEDYKKNKRGKILDNFDVFNPDNEIVLRQIELAGGHEKYKGQILYFGENGMVEYPLRPLHAATDDIVAEILIGQGKNSNASTNFLASQIIMLPGTYKELSPYPQDKQDNVTQTQFEKDVMTMVGNLQGAARMGAVAVMENNLKDMDGKPIVPTMLPFETKNFDRIHEYTEGSCENKIITVSGVPHILVKPTTTGFSTEIMASYYEYYNELTAFERQIFEELAEMLFKNFRGSNLNPSNNWSITPLKLQINQDGNNNYKV
jgi:hypothetical protein